MCDGSLEKLSQNKPNEGEIAVDESSMTPTSNVKRAVQAKLMHIFCLIEYAQNDNRFNWQGFMTNFFFAFFTFPFNFTQFKSLDLIEAIVCYAKLLSQNKEK